MNRVRRAFLTIAMGAGVAQAQDAFREQMDHARAQMDYAREALQRTQHALERLHDTEELDRGLYQLGLQALEERQYEKALSKFEKYYEKLAGKKDSRADGALYWKAYALSKLGRASDALAALALLQKSFPSSRWLNEAKALQLEVNQAAGQPASPEKQNDEELKLLAINSLIHNDPERTVPLLERLLGDPKASPRVKSRALFVLAQSQSTRARDVIARFAKGAGNPDLQLKAVEYLGAHGSTENRQILMEVYNGASDPAVKRAVLRGFMIGRDREHLLAIAKTEKNSDSRVEAIRRLGISGGAAEVAQLYPGESDKRVKSQIIHSLFIQGSARQLVDIARKEADPALKQEIVRRLSQMRSKEATDYMMELLNK